MTNADSGSASHGIAGSPATTSSAVDHGALTYPVTRREELVEDHFGQPVADPYRWLEQDARGSDEVAAWVAAQNEVSMAYLSALPGRERFRQRLTALFDQPRVSIPYAEGGRYFFTRNPGLANQATLLVRDTIDGADRVLLDPNQWSADGTIALAEWAPSRDGELVAYAVQDSGTDWRTVKVIAVATSKERADAVTRVRFSALAWLADGSGFFYSRYPDPVAGAAEQAGLANHAVYFHALGTPQAEDQLVYATPDQPALIHFAAVTDCGDYLVINSSPGSNDNAVAVVDVRAPRAAWTARPLITEFDAEWRVIDNVGSMLYLVTSHGAERRRIVTMDLAATFPTAVELVPADSAVLEEVTLLGDRLAATYLVDAQTEVRRFTLAGEPDGIVALPGIGTAGGFRGHQGDPTAFFGFTSYTVPLTIYRHDVAANTSAVWAGPPADAARDRIRVEQQFFAAKDGTRIPLFIVRREDVTAPAPTVLYGYGGFGISLVPAFSPLALTWVEQGGVYAVANLRGGGEYGKAWHHAGRRDQKQNVFDDFIAAAEYVKASGITAPDGLAVMGGSNGGLLVGAVINQRPDLFAAALPAVGVMDMLRFNKFSGGYLWMSDYGDPGTEAGFSTLYAYSPYHNIADGRDYPAILATTADTDDRVVPAHTFKYTAAIQAAELGPRPRILRTETRAGHGAGKPVAKIIEEAADELAFAAHWTGLAVTAP